MGEYAKKGDALIAKIIIFFPLLSPCALPAVLPQQFRPEAHGEVVEGPRADDHVVDVHVETNQ